MISFDGLCGSYGPGYWRWDSDPNYSLPPITAASGTLSVNSTIATILATAAADFLDDRKLTAVVTSTLFAGSIGGLVSYWRLEEASGNAADSFGGNTLTDNGGVGSAAGKIGNGRDFELSSSQYLSINDNASLSGGDTDFTIAAWVQFESIPAGNLTIAAKYGTTGNQREYWLRYDSGTFTFLLSPDGVNVTTLRATAFGSASVGSWYFVAAYHDSVNDQIGISINGGAFITAAHAGGVFDGSAPFGLGARQSPAADYFDGVIDGAAFFRKVLSAAEISDLFNSGIGRDISLSSKLSNLREVTAAPAGNLATAAAALLNDRKLSSAVAGVLTTTAALLTNNRKLTTTIVVVLDIPADILSETQENFANIDAACVTSIANLDVLRSISATAVGVLSTTAADFDVLRSVISIVDAVLSTFGTFSVLSKSGKVSKVRALNTIEMTVREAVTKTVDFSQYLGKKELIIGVQSVDIFPDGGPVVSHIGYAANGKSVTFKLTADPIGTLPQTYKGRCIVSTRVGNDVDTVEGSFVLKVTS